MASPVNPIVPRVGLVYDERMCGHATPDGEPHPENPQRIRAIWRKLESEGIPQRCVVLNAKQADDKYLASVHTKRHIDLIRSISSKEFDSRRLKIASKFNSIYFNNGSSEAAYLAAGSVIEASVMVAMGDLSSSVAIVRPPGHHAEPAEAMGFCLFNNVAVAANVLLNERPELGIRKILVVDWDVHHGNGTQKAFYKDPRVLFFSVHRFDFGSFYPAGGDGSLCMIGEDHGVGYNINVPWEHGKCGDVDYMAVWDHVLIPVAEAYNPDIVLISAGFDAAIGDPLGGCCITPFGYSLMLKKLMRFAGGKIVMALEGGYNLNSISNSVLACVKTLLEEKTIEGSLEDKPFESTWRVIQEVRNELKTYWPILSVELPEDILISNNQPLPVETAGKVTTRPIGDTNQDIQALAPSSGLFLRRGGDVVILSEGSFLDGLEEFEKLPMREQRKKMKKAMIKGVPFAFRVVSSQETTLKERNKTIAGLRGEVGKLTAEKQLMGEELAQLRPLRQHAGELDRLRKELEEKDFRLEELSQIQRNLEKKDSDLRLAQKRLKEADSALQRARAEEDAARNLAQDLLSDLEEMAASRHEKDRLQDDRGRWLVRKRSSSWLYTTGGGNRGI